MNSVLTASIAVALDAHYVVQKMLFEKFVFKGFGETLKLLNTTQREQGEPQDVQVPGTPTEEEEINDFEELPNYRRLSRN